MTPKSADQILKELIAYLKSRELTFVSLLKKEWTEKMTAELMAKLSFNAEIQLWLLDKCNEPIDKP